MLDKNDIPYLVQLVNEDKRKIISSYKNNEELKQAERAGMVREKVINDLNELYDINEQNEELKLMLGVIFESYKKGYSFIPLPIVKEIKELLK